MTLPAKVTVGEALEAVLIKGDLAKLDQKERADYYQRVCESLGINPYTRPFEYITLQGKLQLYPLRSCADQLRMKHNVSLEIVSRDVSDGVLTVHVRARMPDGRVDEDLGAVPFPPTLVGEARSNAELKAITKAKRRVTLSICGLGWSDESEIESIPGIATANQGVQRTPQAPAANVMVQPESTTLLDEALDQRLTNAADNGTDSLHAMWSSLTKEQRKQMKGELDRYKAIATEADASIDGETGEVTEDGT